MSCRLAILLAVYPALASAASTAPTPVERRVYQTLRANTPPKVDGRLDDGVWQTVDWSGDFVQRDPAEGVPPTKQTQFKVLYDDHALYFAFRAFDDPALLSRLLSRHDGFPGDCVEVNIDSHLDRRTAYSFSLSLSGTRSDEAISNDGDRWDGNWDPVWEGATQVDAFGWTAEMKIPLSQLRFGNQREQTWGLQVTRRIYRQEERSSWQPIPKSGNGWVSRFGELRGITGLAPDRRVELLPYGVSKAERFEAEPGNRFRDGGTGAVTGGLDGKLGVTNDLTLDFTLNPDFGQVEADPSEVNLSAFETFFEEKRPFFIEGNEIFDLQLAPATTGGDFTRDRLFYSRRIGSAPPHSPVPAEDAFVDRPATSSILGAFKLSGKTASGLSAGVLDAVTAREQARIDAGGRLRREEVAPLGNWFVGRLRQDLRGGETQLGLMLTAVHRDLGAPQLEFLPRQAYAGGVDFAHDFDRRAFRVEGNLMASRVAGSPRALRAVQTAPARSFQRPDNDHARFDPTRTALGGYAGSLRLTRAASNSPWRWQTGAALRSPGFEINDLGFMHRADEINQFGWIAYQWRNPFSIFRRLQVNANEWLDGDFGGHVVRKALNTNAHATFRNNQRLGGGITREFEALSNAELRGGPSVRWPGRIDYDAYAGSDARRPLSIELGTNGHRSDDHSGAGQRYRFELVYRPTNALTLSLSPSWSRVWGDQYVTTPSSARGPRYVFGRLDQDTSSLTLRLDLALSPKLTLQYYGAPFISTGRYSALKRIAAPQARSYSDRFHALGPGELSFDAAARRYRVDEDQDGREDYNVARPDFDFREFRSTLVARWEYRPGSAVYLVWSQGRLEDVLSRERPSFGRGLQQLWDAHPHDVLLLKVSKRLPL